MVLKFWENISSDSTEKITVVLIRWYCVYFELVQIFMHTLAYQLMPFLNFRVANPLSVRNISWGCPCQIINASGCLPENQRNVCLEQRFVYQISIRKKSNCNLLNINQDPSNSRLGLPFLFKLTFILSKRRPKINATTDLFK